MTTNLKSYCKFKANSPILGFSPTGFNGPRGADRGHVRKQFTDSLEIEVGLDSNQPIQEFKLTNQSILTWDDYWLNGTTNKITDPKIIRMNLQRNSLLYVNINEPRPHLQCLNLEGNPSLAHLYIHNTPNLSNLNLRGCTGLQYISLGLNRSIQTLDASNCGMPGSVLEQLLRDFRPTLTSSANVLGVGAFRKQSESVIDLRGNEIDWSNRRICSKIRLLLMNNWVVKWSENPPPEVIPPALYAFFVESTLGLR